MKIEYPYEIRITRKEDLQQTILNMCERCPLKMDCDEEIEKKCKTMKMAMVYNFGDIIQENHLKKDPRVLDIQAEELISYLEDELGSSYDNYELIGPKERSCIKYNFMKYGRGFVIECFQLAVMRYGKVYNGNNELS